MMSSAASEAINRGLQGDRRESGCTWGLLDTQEEHPAIFFPPFTSHSLISENRFENLVHRRYCQ